MSKYIRVSESSYVKETGALGGGGANPPFLDSYAFFQI